MCDLKVDTLRKKLSMVSFRHCRSCHKFSKNSVVHAKANRNDIVKKIAHCVNMAGGSRTLRD